MDFLKLVKHYYFGSQCFKNLWSLYCAIETCYINVLSFIFVMQKSICSVLKSLADIFVSETNILQKKSKSRDIFRLSRNSRMNNFKYIRRTWNCWKFCSTDRKQFFHNLELIFRIFKIHFVAKSNFAEQKLLMIIFKKCKRRREGCEKFLKRYCV